MVEEERDRRRRPAATQRSSGFVHSHSEYCMLFLLLTFTQCSVNTLSLAENNLLLIKDKQGVGAHRNSQFC